MFSLFLVSCVRSRSKDRAAVSATRNYNGSHKTDADLWLSLYGLQAAFKIIPIVLCSCLDKNFAHVQLEV